MILHNFWIRRKLGLAQTLLHRQVLSINHSRGVFVTLIIRLKLCKNFALGFSKTSISCPTMNSVCLRPVSWTFIEIAKSTLEDIGIDLWPHSLCFVSLRPHKKAYFALLKLLRSRTDCLNTQLRARSLRLTCRLSTNFSIHLDPAYDFYLPSKPRRPKRNMDSSQPQQLKEVCRSMPPPDAFPPSGFTPISSRSLIGPQRTRKRMCLDFSSEVWDSLAMVPIPRQLHPSLYNKLHISASASGNPGPNRRPAAGNSNTFKKQRFGIFCTGKTEFGLGGRARVISMGAGKQSYRRF
ncbi:hypothetical protein BT96DRAFT_978096 [Gymnopus androsaceus JB14]|uniref:Uncharacterized protein n=1 Tax=Gymnopus androsaceus JB14 TaxID=1447944 RepID=A0A6A4HBQ7_9AGAR|nr:hypothetical protein BT96DRAFT_978096 [Gymnopus androsaceus JB14]